MDSPRSGIWRYMKHLDIGYLAFGRILDTRMDIGHLEENIAAKRISGNIRNQEKYLACLRSGI